MKIFKSEKEAEEYMDISHDYFDREVFQFLGCQGSENFKKVEEITKENFKYSGFEIENFKGKKFEVKIANIETDENYTEYICVTDL